jgi:hypothetical protein
LSCSKPEQETMPMVKLKESNRHRILRNEIALSENVWNTLLNIANGVRPPIELPKHYL